MRAESTLDIVIVDYGMGNLRSVLNKVLPSAPEAVLSSDPDRIMKADKLILPGVGHFQQGMNNLKDLGILPVLNEKVLQEKTPILGICLGMQLMTEFSEEGHVEGLAWLKAKTIRFRQERIDNPYFKVPHMGWNTLRLKSDDDLYRVGEQKEEFYFCHSYHVECEDESIVRATCRYGYEFVASVQKGNIHGAQFHPEKSHDQGARLIERFIDASTVVVKAA